MSFNLLHHQEISFNNSNYSNIFVKKSGMRQFAECNHIFGKLKAELPPHLHYHSLAHTLDVYSRSEYLATEENIAEQDIKLLLVAAAYHDAGYLIQQKDHEDISCDIARRELAQFGYNAADLNTICGIIMATKLPQNPSTHLQEIICDADLDYLGRTDFFETGYNLYLEMQYTGVVKTLKEWDTLQIDFLKNHRFFTQTAIKQREHKKQENLNQLIQKTQNL